MAITYADLQPYIDAGSIPQANVNQPSYGQTGSIPTTGGAYTSRKPGGPTSFGPGFGDPLGSSVFGFGAEKPAWKPYLNEQGQYVWENPAQQNPVPLTSVPGASLKPGKTYHDFANNASALQAILPYLTSAINSQQLPTELTNLQTSQITSPAYAQLQTELYNTFGPVLNQIGNRIQDQNATAQANRDLSVINGPGQDLVNQAYKLSQVYDKPYYDARQSSSDALMKLINSIDLNGGLSGTERNEVGQGLAREGQQRGTQNAPSNTDTISNAMRYGQAGYARQQTAKSNLSDALSKASAFLPSAKSGVDVFQTATGRSSMPNPGNGLFTGVQSPNSNNQFGLAGGVLGNLNQSQMNNNTIESQKKDWIDKFVQITQGIGNLGSVAGGIAGCWIAREIYGESNHKWKQFRKWLYNKAPMSFFKFYMKHGPLIAETIRPFPLIKKMIKLWMDSKITNY